MLRYIKILFLVALAAALIIIGVANRQAVTLSLLPGGLVDEETTAMLSISGVPLFAVIFGALIFGILIGEAMEWSRERKYRREVQQKKRELSSAQRQIKDLMHKLGEDEDLLRLPAA